MKTPLAKNSRAEYRSAKGIVYLACPYTDPDSNVREQRFQAATAAAAMLIKYEGCIVYSPITMTHPIDVVLAGDTATLGSDYWVEFDEAFMDACSEMIILKVPGWEQSSGIIRERHYFESQGKRVREMEPVSKSDLKALLGISSETG